MQNAVRTTIRIRKDLLDQSKHIALKRGTSIQEVINNTLAIGFGHVTDLNTTHESIKRIDAFRKSLRGKNINVNELLRLNKADQK